MKEFSLYRKRIIPDECILLKNDHIVSFENNRLVTTWSQVEKICTHLTDFLRGEVNIKMTIKIK